MYLICLHYIPVYYVFYMEPHKPYALRIEGRGYSRVWDSRLESCPGNKTRTEKDPRGLARCPEILTEVVAETLTYFTEFALELARTGTGELGPPPVPGAGAAVLAGVRPARGNRCEHRKRGQEGASEGVAATSEMGHPRGKTDPLTP